jgi:hypothetical protein
MSRVSPWFVALRDLRECPISCLVGSHFLESNKSGSGLEWLTGTLTVVTRCTLSHGKRPAFTGRAEIGRPRSEHLGEQLRVEAGNEQPVPVTHQAVNNGALGFVIVAAEHLPDGLGDGGFIVINACRFL